MKLTKIVSVVLAGAIPLSAAAQSAKNEIATRAYLIGKWNCSFTVGSRSGTYSTTWGKTLDDMWLTQSITDPGFRSQYFVGYDERHRGWVRFGAMTTGQYFAIRMRDLGDGGWAWKYVSFFPLRRPLKPGDDARFLRRSGTRYTIDGPTYPGPAGALVTEHHTCLKTPSG